MLTLIIVFGCCDDCVFDPGLTLAEENRGMLDLYRLNIVVKDSLACREKARRMITKEPSLHGLVGCTPELTACDSYTLTGDELNGDEHLCNESHIFRRLVRIGPPLSSTTLVHDLAFFMLPLPEHESHQIRLEDADVGGSISSTWTCRGRCQARYGRKAEAGPPGET